MLHSSHLESSNIIEIIAMLKFVKYRDAEAALTVMDKWTNEKNITWHLNVAFLHGYKEDLKIAARHYRLASFFEIDPRTISEVEGFMVWLLEQEPQKLHIYYCLAFFNWMIKGDKIQGAKGFRKFFKVNSVSVFFNRKETGATVD